MVREVEQSNPEIAAVFTRGSSHQMFPSRHRACRKRDYSSEVQCRESAAFAGYSNSDFAYVGIEASQTFPIQ